MITKICTKFVVSNFNFYVLLFHYWNKVTKDLVPEPGSLMYKVLNNYCLLCNESATDDGLPLKPIAVEGSDLEAFAEEGAGKETPEQPEE